ncbi:MAG: hypothetical protein ABEJ70_07930 [Halobacteriaceae archaeon]
MTDGAGRDADGEDRDGGRLGFSLPPLRLPPLFPERLRVVLPAPKPRVVASGWSALAVAVGFDVADAALALAGPPWTAWLRPLVGAAVGTTFLGPLAVVHCWELLAVADPPLGAVPTLTVLVFLRALR